MTETEIVATLVVRDQDRLLLVQQRKPSSFGRWGYPGGHIEPGETLEGALEREIAEEIGANVTEYRPLRVDRKKNVRGHDFEHHAYIGSIEGGITILPEELIGFGWFTLSDLEHMRDQLRDSFILDIARDVFENDQ
jgi:8-oxo-dGTP diphosphatase